MKKIALIIAFFSFICFLGGCKEKIDENNGETEVIIDYIVKENKSDYSIIYPASDTTGSAYFAASEMQNFIEQATGVTLPIYTDKDVGNFTQESKFLSIGNTSLAEQAGMQTETDGVKDGSFSLVTQGKSLFILGVNNRGNIWGVYEFLERYAGVRFLSDDFIHVPESAEIRLVELDDFETPDFEMRNILTGKNWTTNPLYNLRMRMVHDFVTMPEEYGGNSGWFKEIPTTHNALLYVPTDRYLADHPEMYAIKDGQVLDICYTNGITEDGKIDETMEVSAIKAAIESLKDYVKRTNENTLYFMFGQQDHVNAACTCERCVSDSAKYKRSGILMRFANILATEIQKWADETLNGREIRVVTFAYQYSDTAPVKEDGNGGYEPIDETVVAAPNLYIRLAPIYQNNYYPLNDEENQTPKYYNMMQQWKEIGNKFMIWSYHTEFFNGYFLYFPNMHTWKENFKLFKEMGVTYFMMQHSYTEKNNWQAIMQTYVASKLMWDSSLNVSDLVNEFIDLYYGETGAPYIKQFMQLFEDHFMYLFSTHKFEYTCYEEELYRPEYQPLAFLRKGLDILEEGAEAITAKNEESKEVYLQHLKQVMLTPLYSMLYNANYYFGTNASELNSVADKFFGLCEEFDVRYYQEGDNNTIENFRISLGL